MFIFKHFSIKNRDEVNFPAIKFSDLMIFFCTVNGKRDLTFWKFINNSNSRMFTCNYFAGKIQNLRTELCSGRQLPSVNRMADASETLPSLVVSNNIYHEKDHFLCRKSMSILCKSTKIS